MSVRRLVAAFGAAEPDRVAVFWAGLLGRAAVDDDRGLLLAGEDGQLGLRFFESSAAQPGANRMHLHLTSADRAQQEATVATALRLGAHHLDVGQRADEGHIVLGDPEGNAFCVIEPDNSFLAGCGYLGELACDGSRDVGVFWSRALDWPLVWDQGEETAIQSPAGGTKVAWGGPPFVPPVSASRQRFDLVVPTAEHDAEVDRLVELGATRLGQRANGVTSLGDPDGAAFCLVSW